MKNIFKFIKTTLKHTNIEKMRKKLFVVLINGRCFTYYFYKCTGWHEYNLIQSRNINAIDDSEILYNFVKDDENVEFAWLSQSEYVELKKQEIKQDILKELKSKENNNLKLIRTELRKDKGKVVRMGPREDENIGILICAVSTDEDYYYVVVNNNNGVSLRYWSCVGGYEVVEEDSTNMHGWLIKNKLEIEKKVTSVIKESPEVIFTNMNFSKFK